MIDPQVLTRELWKNFLLFGLGAVTGSALAVFIFTLNVRSSVHTAEKVIDKCDASLEECNASLRTSDQQFERCTTLWEELRGLYEECRTERTKCEDDLLRYRVEDAIKVKDGSSYSVKGASACPKTRNPSAGKRSSRLRKTGSKSDTPTLATTSTTGTAIWTTAWYPNSQRWNLALPLWTSTRTRPAASGKFPILRPSPLSRSNSMKGSKPSTLVSLRQ